MYEQHYTAIGNYIYRRTMNEHVTEDLSGDVFLVVMQRLHRFQRRGVPIRVWLYRIANNLVNQWIRREQREQRKLKAKAEVSKYGVRGDNTSDAELAELVRLVNTLSPRYREVIALFYFESMSIAEVGAVLGIKEGTVKSRLNRARQTLRTLLLEPH